MPMARRRTADSRIAIDCSSRGVQNVRCCTFSRESPGAVTTMGTTALGGHDIAIPHARTDQVADILVCVGRSASGVLFEGKEPQTVRLIFLLGTPKKMVMEYLQLLGSLARVLKNEPFRQALLATPTAADFVTAFQQQEAQAEPANATSH